MVKVYLYTKIVFEFFTVASSAYVVVYFTYNVYKDIQKHKVLQNLLKVQVSVNFFLSI